MTTATLSRTGRFEIRWDAELSNWDVIDTRDGSGAGWSEDLAEARQIAREAELEAQKDDLREQIASELDGLSLATLKKMAALLQ